jgi:6,7-dimethyl-8-ribityllumazine synthase
MQHETELSLPAEVNPKWRVGIVSSSFYKEEIESMASAAESMLVSSGINKENISVHTVPGSFEIPLVGSALAKSGKVDALIGLGIIVEGETQHARLLAEQSARGIMDVQLQYEIPFAFEVLYVEDIEQARKRALGDQNKGKEAAHAVLHSLAKLHTILS